MENLQKIYNPDTGDLDFKAFSSVVSMLVWGLIMAKAKTGFAASSSKDKETVSSSFKRMTTILVLLVIASVAKLNADYQFFGSSLMDNSSLTAESDSDRRNLA